MKKAILVLTLLATIACVSAQNFFKPIPKVEQRSYGMSLYHVATIQQDSTLNAIRPIISALAYAYSDKGSLLMSGAGISYQHLKYDYDQQKWTMQYGVSFLMWANGAIAPTTSAGAVSLGVNLHFLNYGSIGMAYNLQWKTACPMIGFTIPLN